MVAPVEGGPIPCTRPSRSAYAVPTESILFHQGIPSAGPRSSMCSRWILVSDGGSDP